MDDIIKAIEDLRAENTQLKNCFDACEKQRLFFLAENIKMKTLLEKIHELVRFNLSGNHRIAEIQHTVVEGLDSL